MKTLARKEQLDSPRATQAKVSRGRWLTTGAGSRLRSQRQDFARALQRQASGRNSGRSTVYAYLREKDSPNGKAGSPYYVGVAGELRRPYMPHGRTPVPSDERRIRVLRQNVTHEQARAWEKYYIEKFGRKDIKSGRRMLINRTDGGDGVVGRKYSAAYRAKLSAASKGRTMVFSPEHRASISAGKKGRPNGRLGKAHSAEAKAKVGAANRGRTHSAETIARRSASALHNKAIRIGVDSAIYASLSPSQRRSVNETSKRQGITPSEYLEKMRPGWGI